MTPVEGEQHIRLRFARTLANDDVIGSPAGDLESRGSLENVGVSISRQGDDGGAVDEVRFDQRPGVRGGQPMRWGQSGEDRICFDERVRGTAQPIAARETPVDLGGGSGVMLVP